jgi:hypothetical protein
MFVDWVWTPGEYDRHVLGIGRRGITLKGGRETWRRRSVYVSPPTEVSHGSDRWFVLISRRLLPRSDIC